MVAAVAASVLKKVRTDARFFVGRFIPPLPQYPSADHRNRLACAEHFPFSAVRGTMRRDFHCDDPYRF